MKGRLPRLLWPALAAGLVACSSEPPPDPPPGEILLLLLSLR